MNLLEHYIQEIHSVTDITSDFESHYGYPPVEPLYTIDITYDCHGTHTRKIVHLYKSEWEEAKIRGYFMA